MAQKVILGKDVRPYLLLDGRLLLTMREHPELTYLGATSHIVLNIPIDGAATADVTFIVGDVDDLPAEIKANVRTFKCSKCSSMNLFPETAPSKPADVVEGSNPDQPQ
jgi:hypothetical protein